MPPTALSAYNIDDAVKIKWSDHQWYAAKVVDKKVERARTELEVTYAGWNASWNEWIRAPSKVQWPNENRETSSQIAQNVHGTTDGCTFSK